MRSVIMSQWRERRTRVIWQDFGALTTVRARESCDSNQADRISCVRHNTLDWIVINVRIMADERWL